LIFLVTQSEPEPMTARTHCTGTDGLPRPEKMKKLLAACKWQTALSAKNAGEASFLTSSIHAQKAARLYGEAGIIIRQSTEIGVPARGF